jgi:polyhydroxyalkanoate synthase subunit PhaE
MSETGLWTKDWLETQQKYWETWTDMSRKALGLETSPETAWEQALEHWWKAVSPALPGPTGEFMSKIMDQGKGFFRIADDIIRNLDLKVATGSDWTKAFNKTLSDMQQAFRGELNTEGEAAHRLMAFWELPFDNWQRMVSTMSLMPGDILRNVPHDEVRDNLHRFLSAPGLGYSREEQSQYQDLMRRGLDYQRSLQMYSQFFSGMGIKAVERMREVVVKKFEDGKPIDSTRVLYDVWVDACESVYGEEVASEEYAAVHGDLVNSLMAFKHRLGNIVDESLGSLNMPTRAELRTVQDRLQETRRENKRLRRDLDALMEQLLGQGEAAAAGGTEPARVVTKKAPAPRRKSAEPRVSDNT